MYDKSHNDRVFIDDLSDYGRITLLTTVNIVTRDKHPAPFSQSTESSDLVEYRPTLSQTKQIDSLDTSTFGGVFTPTILDENKLLLTTCLNYKVTKHLQVDGLILPNTSISQQMNHTKLKSGETNVSTWFQLSSGKKNQLIVLTTPTIL